MSIIDTHAHLYLPEFQDDFENVISRCKEAGVAAVLLPNIDEETITDLKKSVAFDPDLFYPMMGLHPTSVTKEWPTQLSKIYSELEQGIYVAVGEVGIDLHWDESLKMEQIKAFETQLEWSRDYDLPLSIHFRNAFKEVVESVKRFGKDSLRGVFHSFGGSREELDEIASLGNFLIGINGVVTFKNSGLFEVLIDCPTDLVVLETDSPYLSPSPFRGKRNESGYLPFIIEKLANAWKMDNRTVEAITTKNAATMFNVPLS